MCLSAKKDEGMPGAIYEIEGQFLPWLWPVLEISGVLLQLGAIPTGKNSLFAGGMLLVIIGAVAERDLAFLVGDICICVALWAGARR